MSNNNTFTKTASNMLNDLTCPISLEFFDDPVSVPCCGKAFSRQTLIEHINTVDYDIKCPSCNGNLENFDIHNAPKNVILASLVEEIVKMAQNNIQPVTQPQIQQNNTINKKNENLEPEWKCIINHLTDEDDNDMPVGELKLSLQNAGFAPRPCLFIVVVDQSGSMSGKPWQQVQSALIHIMRQTYSNPHVKTVVVSYSNIADVINTNDTLSNVENRIKMMNAEGGTSFPTAFQKVKTILSGYECKDDSISPNNVSGAVITFMTDGEDGSGKSNDVLTSMFKESIESNWTGPYSVHTVGFGSSHNFDLLEKMRKIGTNEGFYRYSDNNDEGDALCGKLTAIFDVVSSSSTIPVTIQTQENYSFYEKNKFDLTTTFQFPINDDGNGSLKKWIRIPINRLDEELKLNIKARVGKNGEEMNITLQSKIQYCTADIKKQLFNRWIINLVDEIAIEAMDLGRKNRNEYGINVFELHCILLLQRSQAINKYLGTDDASILVKNRLESITSEIESMKRGSTISMGRLNDLRFSSQFNAPKPIMKPVVQNNTKSVIQPVFTNNYVSDDVYNLIRLISGRGWTNIHHVIANYCKVDRLTIINNASYNELTNPDQDGNTPLMWASYIGRIDVVRLLLEKLEEDDINKENNNGQNCLELALNKGHWISSEILVEKGIKVSASLGKKLLKFALQRSYVKTASVILSAGFAELDERMNNSFPPETINWLLTHTKASSKRDSQSYLNLAVNKGMVDLVKKLLSEGAKSTKELVLETLIPNSKNHAQILELLLENGADVNGGIPQEGGQDTPLFIASQKGCLDQVKVLINHGAIIDCPNASKNTPLWIACCNRHSDIVMELLNYGADPNYANDKGNTPLIPACQRGSDDIVMMLLMKSVDVDFLNTNGDSPILICCRTGQSKVLEMILNKANDNSLKHRAHIDGFNALFAATESDKDKCIEIIIQHGANIEEKTDDDNPIVAGATSLHLAAFYGRLNAAKMLLNLGANPNSYDINMSTPLHIAVKQGHIKIVQLLRSYKANLLAKDSSGFIPAFYCKNNQEIKDELIDPLSTILMKLARRQFTQTEEDGACKVLENYTGALGCLSTNNAVDVLSSDGKTPLLEAVIYSSIKLVKTLLKLGADPLLTDKFGLNSYTWAEWIGNKEIKQILLPLALSPSLRGDLPKSQTVLSTNNVMVEPLDRLKTVAKDMKNGMVIYMANRPPVNLDISMNEISNISDKMNKFINITQSNLPMGSVSSLSNINNSSNTSIVTFFDKLNDQKMGKNGGSTIQTLLWNAKIFITGAIASGMAELQPQHMLAINMYTSNTTLSYIVNEAMISGDIKYVLPYVQCLTEALNMLPNYKGEVYRTVTEQFDRKLYTKGNIITWPIFSTASLDWNNGNFDFSKKCGTIFIIKTKNAKIIKEYSQYPEDSEVMLLPNTQYKVTRFLLCDPVCLGQKNIREKTFGIKDEDLHKYLNTNENVIIELEEL